MGRKAATGGAREKPLLIRANPEERARLDRAADLAKPTNATEWGTSTWLRLLGLAEADRLLSEKPPRRPPKRASKKDDQGSK